MNPISRLVSIPRDIKFLFSAYPSHLVLYVTAQCNLICKHCFYYESISKSHRSKELTFDEINSIFSSYPDITYVTITGGEPSIRDDLPQICNILSRKNKVAYFAYHTNGYNTKKIVTQIETLCSVCPDSFFRASFSIDGPPEIHDAIRGVKGSFERCVETILQVKKLKKKYKNLDIDVACVCSETNKKYTEWLINYVEYKMEVRLQFIFLRGAIRESSYTSISTEEFRSVIKKLQHKRNLKIKEHYTFSTFKKAIDNIVPKVVVKISERGKMRPSCQAGKRTIVLDEEGNVKICELLPFSVGNVREHNYDLCKIIKESKSEIKNHMKKCVCTWECILPLNILFSPYMYPRIIFEILKLTLRRYNRLFKV
jgi:MoaA/NifB/PqqE/SkfB family radical SAM enzyme